jgi:hypothetical protein
MFDAKFNMQFGVTVMDNNRMVKIESDFIKSVSDELAMKIDAFFKDQLGLTRENVEKVTDRFTTAIHRDDPLRKESLRFVFDGESFSELAQWWAEPSGRAVLNFRPIMCCLAKIEIKKILDNNG